MQLYSKNLTHQEVIDMMNDFFLNHKTGRIVKLKWLLKNFPEYTKNVLREIYGNFEDFNNVNELLYNIYYPNCKKICDVCGKKLDGFHHRKGYYQSLKHKVCRKPWGYEKFSDYHELFNQQIYQNGAAINFLSRRDDIINLIDQFKIDYPKFGHYAIKDCVYILVMSETDEEFSKFPLCYCGKICRPQFVNKDYDKFHFSKNCYDKECLYKTIISESQETILDRYKVSNVSKLQFIKEKKAQTTLSHYGNWNNFMQQTVFKWCRDQGIENPSQLEYVKDKKEKNLLNLGYSSWNEYLKEIITVWCEKQGIKNASQLEEVKNKKIQNYLEKSGGLYTNPFQDSEVIAKIKEYWENHPDEWKMAHILSGEMQKLHKSKINHFRKGCTGITEFDVLNELEKECNINIYRQVSCMQYFIDGYVKEGNIAIEYDEKTGHSKESDIQHDAIRQKEIEDYCSCTFIRISQEGWKNDKSKYINEVKRIISESNNLTNDKIKIEELPNKAYRIRKIFP